MGRDPDLELFLDSQGVSRRHALIRIAGEEATVEDLGSKNGTFIADRRLDSPTRLVEGDVRLGPKTTTTQRTRERMRSSPAMKWLLASTVANLLCMASLPCERLEDRQLRALASGSRRRAAGIRQGSADALPSDRQRRARLNALCFR